MERHQRGRGEIICVFPSIAKFSLTVSLPCYLNVLSNWPKNTEGLLLAAENAVFLLNFGNYKKRLIQLWYNLVHIYCHHKKMGHQHQKVNKLYHRV